MKILLTSTQYPGNGGAATNTYKLNKYFLSQKIKTYCIFILCQREDISKINIDPDNLGNVSYIRCSVKNGEPLDYDHKKYIKYTPNFINQFKNKIIKYLGGTPDIILSKNYLAPITSHFLFPESKIYYLVSGLFYMSILNNYRDEFISAQMVLNKPNYYVKLIDSFKKHPIFINILQEIQTLKMVDRVIYNSQLTCNLSKLYFGDLIKNETIINTSLLKHIDNTCDNFNTRPYDIIFVSSSFKRKIKNPPFVNKLFLDKRLSLYKKIVIGDNNIFDPQIENITILNQQLNSKVLEYMKNSKLLILPSLFDSSPNTIYEALEAGCNIVTSKNIGNYQIFNRDSICEDVYDIEEWIQKIRNNLDKKIINNINVGNIIDELLEY